MADSAIDLDPLEQRGREIAWAIDDARASLREGAITALQEMERAEVFRIHPARNYSEDFSETVDEIVNDALRSLLAKCELPGNVEAYAGKLP